MTISYSMCFSKPVTLTIISFFLLVDMWKTIEKSNQEFHKKQEGLSGNIGKEESLTKSDMNLTPKVCLVL